jgi:hypothetical protein
LRSDDLDSKSNLDSEQQLLKELREISTTEFGMQIDPRDEHSAKAKEPMWRTLETPSKVIVKS